MNQFVIGIGSFPHKEKLKDILPIADTLGFSFVDTSDDYENEYYVGNSVENDSLKIFTKFSYIHKLGEFDKQFLEAKHILETKGGVLWCYLMHWPYPFLYKLIWKKMEELYLTGQVKEIGVCNFTSKHLKNLLKDCRVKPMYNEIEIHPLFQQKETVEYCKKNGIQVISYSPLARRDKRLIENEKIIAIAERENTSIVNVILKWNIVKGQIPIPSTSNVLHLKDMSMDNLRNIKLNDEDIRVIDSLECNGRVRHDPNKYFSIKMKLKFLLMYLKYR